MFDNASSNISWLPPTADQGYILISFYAAWRLSSVFADLHQHDSGSTMVLGMSYENELTLIIFSFRSQLHKIMTIP